MKFKGKVIYEGYQIADAYVVKKEVKKETRVFEGEEKEFARFSNAREAAKVSFDESYELTLKTLGEEEAMLFQTHKLMAEDGDFEDLVKGAIAEEMLAEDAVKAAGEQLAEMFRSLDDEYMKERAADVIEVASVISNLISGNATDINLTKPSILVCEDLEASKLMKVNKEFLKGIIFTRCGTTSHVAIFTRTLEIPAICSINDLNIADFKGDEKIGLDAVKGYVYINPNEEETTYLKEQDQKYEEEKKELKNFIDKKTVSKDGKPFQIYANIGSSDDALAAVRHNAEGIGLFRSEFLYLESKTYPSEEEQLKHYKKVLQAFNGREVIVRTFDIGADKKADYFNLPDEENPALGYRSIRICRDRPEMFLTQIRALLRASVYGKLGIMVPMVISLDEIDFIHETINTAKKQLDAEGIPYSNHVKVGIMVETPAAAIMSDVFAKKVDFFSIGTNDLSQYTLACDRLNSNLNKTFNHHDKAILRLIEMTVRNAHNAGIPCGMCGELARDPELVPFLMKIGLDEFSISSSYVLKTRKLMSTIDTSLIDINNYIN